MEQLTLFEQDLINAICIFQSKFKNVSPDEVEVELMYDDVTGYSAEAYVNGQMDIYQTPQFITALRVYIDEQLNKDSMSARIVLDIDDEDGMIARISW